MNYFRLSTCKGDIRRTIRQREGDRSETTVTHVPLNECVAIGIAIHTLDMQMCATAAESEIITGIAESLTEQATISVNLSLRVFLAIITRSYDSRMPRGCTYAHAYT